VYGYGEIQHAKSTCADLRHVLKIAKWSNMLFADLISFSDVFRAEAPIGL
jgi:hypothetical protein